MGAGEGSIGDETMNGKELMESLVEQGYMENQELSTGKDGIGLTSEGYEALQMLLLTLTADHLMRLFSNTLPRVLELDSKREDVVPPSPWEALSS